MNKQQISDYIKNVKQPDSGSTEILTDLIDRFPYFQPAHYLYLKGLKNTNDIKFDQQLKISSAYVTDRKLLFTYLNENLNEHQNIISADEMTSISEFSKSDILLEKKEEIANTPYIMQEVQVEKITEVQASVAEDLVSIPVMPEKEDIVTVAPEEKVFTEPVQNVQTVVPSTHPVKEQKEISSEHIPDEPILLIANEPVSDSVEITKEIKEIIVPVESIAEIKQVESLSNVEPIKKPSEIQATKDTSEQLTHETKTTPENIQPEVVSAVIPDPMKPLSLADQILKKVSDIRTEQKPASTPNIADLIMNKYKVHKESQPKKTQPEFIPPPEIIVEQPIHPVPDDLIVPEEPAREITTEPVTESAITEEINIDLQSVTVTETQPIASEEATIKTSEQTNNVEVTAISEHSAEVITPPVEEPVISETVSPPDEIAYTDQSVTESLQPVEPIAEIKSESVQEVIQTEQAEDNTLLTQNDIELPVQTENTIEQEREKKQFEFEQEQEKCESESKQEKEQILETSFVDEPQELIKEQETELSEINESETAVSEEKGFRQKQFIILDEVSEKPEITIGSDTPDYSVYDYFHFAGIHAQEASPVSEIESEQIAGNEAKDKSFTFNQWLDIISGKISQTEQQKPKDKIKKSEIIDRFIVQNPKITPVANLPSFKEKTNEPDPIDDDYITETLANIYVKQGYYSKAIMAFEKLCLKYPEKNIYFAGQIEKIKELITNKKI